MEDSETELTSSEPDALGADFITVELDTQPIEYVVKWAEVGSKFTISCVKKEADEGSGLMCEEVKTESDEAFFSQYEEVYAGCDVAEQSVEIKTDSDEEDITEPGSSQLGDEDVSDSGTEKGDYNSEDRNYRCNYCGKSYSHSSSLSRHLQKHTGKSMIPPASRPKQPEPVETSQFQCVQCGLRFKGSRSLGVHKKTHLGKRLFPCNICGKDFNHSSSLSRHRLIHKKGKGIPRVLQDMSHVRQPANAGTRTKKGKKKKKQLQQQQKRQKLQRQPQHQGGEKFYACTQCEMTFKTSTALSKHQVTHVRELLTNYTQGTDDLTKSSDLKIRLKLCSRDKPNFYTLCKKNKRSRAAKRASTSEDEEGLFACKQCDKRFSHASSLARHQQMHKGENKFNCSYCRKTFTRLSNLHHHEKSHSSEKHYECTACNKTFVHSSSFSRHKKAHAEQGRASKLRQRKRGAIDETAPLESDSE
ncbi:zinc finger protein 135 [Hypomesus transpacificus]|uniref:zinc finger protein 135 n=1 Tax=Hypomesus transpacificus TaxID=137520 RepID=UPI001F082AC8|nr:zinc finger protein 135 [Hypomesus transpacificus]XP_046885693.1 zinc finger protein 135 [Hypomesus transpacificus]XP_046885694.1 zinc finger protein 135 [Hypomesus transpacificus]XP_046885695.1 zinc finger protein 135 [Hypomesus transpacificus]